MRRDNKPDSKIGYPKDARTLTLMLTAANTEVTKLSSTVSLQAQELHALRNEVMKWQERFDTLLEIRR